MKETILILCILVSTSTAVTGCAGKPVTELREAREAIQAAKSAGAERYAPGPLTEAQKSYNEAEEGAATREELRELYIRAAIQAKIAVSAARMKEAEETLDQVQEDHAKAKEATSAAKSKVDESRSVLSPMPLTPVP